MSIAAGDPTETLPQLVQESGASLLVTDFTPLRLGRQWKEGVAAKLEVRRPLLYSTVRRMLAVPLALSVAGIVSSGRKGRPPSWR